MANYDNINNVEKSFVKFFCIVLTVCLITTLIFLHLDGNLKKR